jgi:Predicted outer membrane protein
MKTRKWLVMALATGIMVACNNEASDSVEKADSANEAKLDAPGASQTIQADEASADFLVKAADMGMAEVELGKLAQEKARNEKVKQFGAMMVNDHTQANNEVKSLASQRNVSLPDSASNEKKKDRDDLAKKSGADFDKAFMKAMVNDHDATINLFEKASNDVKDPAVKTFVDNTLPKLRSHLDSAKTIQKGLK